jgi:hypothetical protein
MKKILKNYKTTIPGLLIAVSLGLYWFGKITKEQLETGITILTVAGLLGAKDFTQKDSQ